MCVCECAHDNNVDDADDDFVTHDNRCVSAMLFGCDDQKRSTTTISYHFTSWICRCWLFGCLLFRHSLQLLVLHFIYYGRNDPLGQRKATRKTITIITLENNSPRAFFFIHLICKRKMRFMESTSIVSVWSNAIKPVFSFCCYILILKY